MFDAYFTEVATLLPKTGDNDYAEPTYGAAQSILCRIEPTSRLVRTDTGKEVAASGMVMTKTALAPGDLVNGRRIVQSGPMKNLAGQLSHYEGYLL